MWVGVLYIKPSCCNHCPQSTANTSRSTISHHETWFATHHHDPRCSCSFWPESAIDKAQGLRWRSHVNNMYWSQLKTGERLVTSWTGPQSIKGRTYRDKQLLTVTPKYNLESSMNLELHVIDLWEDAWDNFSVRTCNSAEKDPSWQNLHAVRQQCVNWVHFLTPGGDSALYWEVFPQPPIWWQQLQHKFGQLFESFEKSGDVLSVLNDCATTGRCNPT